jgi:hypothetical protein
VGPSGTGVEARNLHARHTALSFRVLEGGDKRSGS